MLAAGACRRLLAAFQARSQRGKALFEKCKGLAMVPDPAKLIDFVGQGSHVVRELDQCIVGGDIGDDGTQGGDSAFKLLDGGGVVTGAQDLVELGAEGPNG